MMKLRIVATFLAFVVLGALTVPAWAANVTVADASSFGSSAGQLGTATLSNLSSNPCLTATTSCSTVTYTVDIASQVFLSSGTYTYVYAIKLDTATNYSCTGNGIACINPVTSPNSSLTLSSLTIGSTGFNLAALNWGTVGTCSGVCGGITGYSTSSGTSFTGTPQATSTSTVFGGGGLVNLGVGKTLLVYAQSFNPPLFVSASTLDGGNSANSVVAGPSTPEPTSMALLGSGLALMGGFLRRRNRRPLSQS